MSVLKTSFKTYLKTLYVKELFVLFSYVTVGFFKYLFMTFTVNTV